MIRYIKTSGLVAAALGELVSPMGKTEAEAVELLTEYLLNDDGRERFYALYPDATESDYYEALYELYELAEEGQEEAPKALLSGRKVSECRACGVGG